MPSLAEFQQSFGAALADLGPAGDDAPLARAFAVHRNTSVRAAQDALAANYPVVESLFGEEPFAACAVAYVTLSPPTEPRLSLYGAAFAPFLARYAPAMSVPYAADIAALEWLCVEALFSADANALSGAEAAQALDPSAHLHLHPAARVAAFRSPVVSIWSAHREGDVEALGDLVWTPEAALVTRPAGDVRVRRLAAGGVEFLEACAAGESLGVAAAAAVSAGAELETLFSQLIDAGAFAQRPSRSLP